MKKILLITAVVLALSFQSCAWFFPNQSKALTEAEQLEVQKSLLEEEKKQTSFLEERNNLLKEQNEILKNNK